MDKSALCIANETQTSAAADVLARDGIAGFLSFYDDAFVSKQTVGDQWRTYALAEHASALDWDDADITPGRAQLKLKLFAQAMEDTGHAPAAAALYAKALMCVAALHGEPDWSHRISRQATEKRTQCAVLARDLFETTRTRAGDCALWHRARFQLGLSDGCESDELAERFAAALSFDGGEQSLYTERACQLLPRWHGSFGELETFARAASAQTETEFGGSLYARIYSVIARHEYIRDTDADWGHLKASMEAWCEQTGCQRLLNVYASMADAFGDQRLLAELLETRIKAYYPGAWLASEQAADVFSRMAPRR